MSDLLSKGRLKMSETEWFVYTLVDYSTVCTYIYSELSVIVQQGVIIYKL